LVVLIGTLKCPIYSFVALFACEIWHVKVEILIDFWGKSRFSRLKQQTLTDHISQPRGSTTLLIRGLIVLIGTLKQPNNSAVALLCFEKLSILSKKIDLWKSLKFFKNSSSTKLQKLYLSRTFWDLTSVG